MPFKTSEYGSLITLFEHYTQKIKKVQAIFLLM
jgi:hypothetical protein